MLRFRGVGAGMGVWRVQEVLAVNAAPRSIATFALRYGRCELRKQDPSKCGDFGIFVPGSELPVKNQRTKHA